MSDNKFHMNKLARSMALGEVFEENTLSASGIMYELGFFHNTYEHGLPVKDEFRFMTGAQLMKLVTEYETGFKSVMQVAYNAGKEGKVIV